MFGETGQTMDEVRVMFYTWMECCRDRQRESPAAAAPRLIQTETRRRVAWKGSDMIAAMGAEMSSRLPRLVTSEAAQDEVRRDGVAVETGPRVVWRQKGRVRSDRLCECIKEPTTAVSLMLRIEDASQLEKTGRAAVAESKCAFRGATAMQATTQNVQRRYSLPALCAVRVHSKTSG